MDERLQEFVSQAPMQIGRDHSWRAVHAGGAMDVYVVPLLEHAFEDGHTVWQARLKLDAIKIFNGDTAEDQACSVGCGSFVFDSTISAILVRLETENGCNLQRLQLPNSSSTRGSEPTARLGKTQVYFMQRHHNPERLQDDAVISPAPSSAGSSR